MAVAVAEGPGWALVVTGHAVGGNAARLKWAQKGGAGGDPEETAVGGGRRGRLLGRPRLLEDVASDQVRRPVQVGLLLTCCSCALSGMSLRLPDPFVGRRDEKAVARRMAEIRRPVADLLQDGWEACTVDEVRARHEAETRRTRPSPGGRARLYVDRKKASRSFFGAPSLTTKKTRTTPIEGDQDAEQTCPRDGLPGARDR